MRNTKKAFTLVELIVVITILAILGTIAFISLQGYSSDARNSKRTSDLGSIISKMTIEITKWVSLLSFVADNTSAVTGITIAWTGVTAADYKAWVVNYLALDMKESEFQDPVDSPYVMWITTKAGAKYQVAATKETWGWAPVAVIKGNWNSRLVNAFTSTGVNARAAVTLQDAQDSNKIKVGDYVTTWSSTGVLVTKVSDNGMIVTLAWNVTTQGITIQLAVADSWSLIWDVDSNLAISEGWVLVPYKIN